jgi:hypothetical protein
MNTPGHNQDQTEVPADQVHRVTDYELVREITRACASLRSAAQRVESYVRLVTQLLEQIGVDPENRHLVTWVEANIDEVSKPTRHAPAPGQQSYLDDVDDDDDDDEDTPVIPW